MPDRALTRRRAAREARERCRDSRNDVVKDAVLSLISAALPPAPRAALKLVQSLRASTAR